MTIYAIINPMGKGKTLCASLYAKEYAKLNPKAKIYSNYNLLLPNVVFTPYLFLDYSSLNNNLIIADDIYSMQNLDGFMAIIVNMSRKLNLDCILTCQYYTMVPKEIRVLCTLIEVAYDKFSDRLAVGVEFSERIELYVVREATKKAKELYNTNEVVNISTQSKIETEILKYSKNLEDLEINISLFAKNKATQTRMFKKLKKEFE